jgi:hypothetical protein
LFDGNNMVDQLTLTPSVVDALRERLPEVATHTIDAVQSGIPAYARGFGDPMGATIENAVQLALAGFFRLASLPSPDGGTPLTPALEGAYALGRGEARSGRSADALLAAYRVGARAAWREMAATAVSAGADGESIASFAELVFAYIDELSAASVAGHTDEVESTGRLRQRRLDLLAQAILRGEPEESLAGAAERAGWRPPRTLTAVLLPRAQIRPVLAGISDASLVPSEGTPGLPEERGVVLVADMAGRSRARLLRLLAERSAIVGPARPWSRARASYQRALRALPLAEGPGAVDTDQRLPELVLAADEEAYADLRARALAPLDDLTPAARERLTATLRSWLLHQGRREAVAADLFVHPQTVRYRMGQLREIFGDDLDDPTKVRDLILALG